MSEADKNVTVTVMNDEEPSKEDTTTTTTTEEEDTSKESKETKQEEAPSTTSVTTKRTVKQKGRGFKSTKDDDEDETRRYEGKSGQFESVEADSKDKITAQKSVEGWIIFVTGIHEEAQEDDIYELFAEYGQIKQINMNLDRRTGYVKGYALIEYNTFEEAQEAIKNADGHELMEQKLAVDWAFKKAEQTSSSSRHIVSRRRD